MGLAVWVVCVELALVSTSTFATTVGREDAWGLTVRAGRSAAVGVIAEGMDVHATLSAGVVARNVP